MKLKITIAFLVGMILGAIACRAWDIRTATARHWRAVREYSAYMRNPENDKPTGKGFTVASEPFDPIPHLAALVSENELIYEDIVLPSVPYQNRAVTKHWMAFCERLPKEIAFALAYPDNQGQPILEAGRFILEANRRCHAEFQLL